MEKNKYFTPDIEDIHIGYECEILYPHNMIEYNEKLNENLWEKHKFELRESLSEGDSMSFDYMYRTLYLTNQQLENEGWKYYQNIPDMVVSEGYVEYYKDVEWFKVVISISETSHYLDVQKVFQNVQIGDELQEFRNTIYNGHCKDINTFRKIIKLLGI
jgi:hypothetical protein